MPIEIPLPNSVPLFELQIELDGVTYSLELRWNARAGAWFAHLRDAEGGVLVMGRRVVVDFPLFSRTQKAGAPPGQLVAVDTSGKQQDPVLDDLGARVRLIYVTEAELA